MLISTQKIVHLTGLNGFRALAAAGVVISHITTSAAADFGMNTSLLGTQENHVLLLAYFGVTIFFVLSGFLITYLLLKEKEIQPVNIKHFYVRRILRIWPLYYLYLFISLIVTIAFALPANNGLLPYYLFMAANVPVILNSVNIPYLLGHYWSLSVEEQFYAFWPWIAKIENSRLLKWAIGITVGLIFLKCIFWVLATRYGIDLPLVAISLTRFQCMLIGSVGAILFYANHEQFIQVATHKVTQLICWGVILFIIVNRFHIASLIDHEFVSVVTLCLIIGQVTRRNHLINLDTRVCNFIGKISYGIYVYHMLVIFAVTRLLKNIQVDQPVKYVLLYTLVPGITIIIAYASYRLFEKRFLQLKFNFSAVKSSDTAVIEVEKVPGKVVRHNQ